MTDFNVQEIMVEIDQSIAGDVRVDGAAILTAVTFGSPVGDPTLWQNPRGAPPGYAGGHLRRNWHISIGGFSDEEIGEPGSASGEAEAAAAIGRGQGVIDGYTDISQGILVIQNNVPYIVPISEGSSSQAPPGWIEMAVQIAGQATDPEVL